MGTRTTTPIALTRYKEQIQAELISVLPDISSELSGPFGYHLGWIDRSGERITTPTDQGKALRPSLCLFACQALGGDWIKAMPAALALELIHNFSLIHDDIQDGDTKRRHQPTVWYLWGQPKALLTGDAMHGMAYRVALDLTARGISDKKSLRVSSLLMESCLSMINGQTMDLQYENRLDINLTDYLEMIRLKTGSLFETSLEIGALLARDEEEQIQALASYGRHLGLAFQIRDDILGIWGNEKYTGKAGNSSSNDILRKKKSFPIVFALEQAEATNRKTLRRIYKKQSINQQDMDQVMGILDQMKAHEYAQKLVVKEATLALEELKTISLGSWASKEARKLVGFLTSRDY